VDSASKQGLNVFSTIKRRIHFSSPIFVIMMNPFLISYFDVAVPKLFGQLLHIVLELIMSLDLLVNVGNGATNGCLQENNIMLWVLQPFAGLFGKHEIECALKGKW
jgi:hypothetical protein